MKDHYFRCWSWMRRDWLWPEKRCHSRVEAWLDLLWMARIYDDPETGLMRGQLEASERFLSKRWLWPKTTTRRFLLRLMDEGRISRVDQETDHKTDRLSICNYEVYCPIPDQETDHKTDQRELRIRNKYSPREFNSQEKSSSSREVQLQGGNGIFPISLPLKDGSDFRIPMQDIREWCRTYPAVNVEQEIAEMRQWCLSNPNKLKVNGRRFVTNWLAQEQKKQHRPWEPGKGERERIRRIKESYEAK